MRTFGRTKPKVLGATNTMPTKRLPAASRPPHPPARRPLAGIVLGTDDQDPYSTRQPDDPYAFHPSDFTSSDPRKLPGQSNIKPGPKRKAGKALGMPSLPLKRQPIKPQPPQTENSPSRNEPSEQQDDEDHPFFPPSTDTDVEDGNREIETEQTSSDSEGEDQPQSQPVAAAANDHDVSELPALPQLGAISETEEGEEEEDDEEEDINVDSRYGSDWEPSSDEEDEWEVTNSQSKKSLLKTVNRVVVGKGASPLRKTTTSKQQQRSFAAATKSGTLPSGADSQFAISLTDPLSAGRKKGTSTGSGAPASTAAPPAAVKKPRAGKKNDLGNKTSLPVIIPPRVARDPSGTGVLVELPAGAELDGATGVVGRILGGVAATAASGGDGHDGMSTHEAHGGMVLDILGVQYSADFIRLPSTIAIAHLTGGQLVVDSLFNTAVQAVAVPGQVAVGESVFPMSWEGSKEDEEHDDDDDDGEYKQKGSAKTRKKGGAAVGRKRKAAAVHAYGVGVRRKKPVAASTKKKKT